MKKQIKCPTCFRFYDPENNDECPHCINEPIRNYQDEYDMSQFNGSCHPDYDELLSTDKNEEI